MSNVMESEREAAKFSPYAPVRYRPTTWWKFARDMARAGGVTAQGQIKAGVFESIQAGLIDPALKLWFRKSENTELAKYDAKVASKMVFLRQWVPLAAQFEVCGRQIYDLTDELVDMLRNTDVSDCTLEGWNPPYSAFFIRVGKQDEARLPFGEGGGDYEYLDGVFVAESYTEVGGALERWIRFGFTTVRENGEGMALPGYFLDFVSDMLGLPIPQAIDAAISDWARLLASNTGSDDISRAIAQAQRLELDDAASLFRAAIPLVINALFYIESQPGSGILAPGRDVPEDLVKKWSAVTGRQQLKLASRLTSEGYAVVKLMGSELSSGPASGLDGAHGGKRTHWRRGHWRQQAYGPQMSLRKRTWLKPVMVNADRPHDDLPGRIYKVQNNRPD